MTDRIVDFVPVVEALIFASMEPLPTRRLSELLPELSSEDLVSVLDRLRDDLETGLRGIRLEEVAGGWRFSTRPEHAPFIERSLKSRRPRRLSRAALETLAVAVYRQPVTKAEIEAVRGVSVDGPLRTLLDRGLVKVKGRAEAPGRPLLYTTTRELLQYLGLMDLRDLPRVEELEAVLESSEDADPAQLVIMGEPESSGEQESDDEGSEREIGTGAQEEAEVAGEEEGVAVESQDEEAESRPEHE